MQPRQGQLLTRKNSIGVGNATVTGQLLRLAKGLRRADDLPALSSLLADHADQGVTSGHDATGRPLPHLGQCFTKSARWEGWHAARSRSVAAIPWGRQRRAGRG